jgi:hypothetical protein
MDAKTGLCLEIERFNQLDWPVQRERIAAFVKQWNGRLVMDATGVGDPVFDDLRRVLPLVEGFKITAQTKRELVQGLMVAVEQRRVMWPAGKGRSGISELGGMSALSGGQRTEDRGRCGIGGGGTAEARRRISNAERRTPNAQR